MKALYFITGDEALVQEINIDNDLKSLQEAVGGYIETVTIATDACLICNEEGRLLDLRPQTIMGLVFYGNVLLVGTKGDEFTDVPEGWVTMMNRRMSA